MKNFTKLFLAACMITGFAFSLNAQSVGINSDGSSPNSKAILDLSSTSKGFLPPRMTFLEKTAITSPPAGLIVWCSNCGASGELQVYNGTAWTNLTVGAASGLPGAPTIGTVTEGVAQASVPFTAPASNGGSTIISYTATSSPGSITGTLTQAGSGTITVTGLTNGTTYTFTVTATNATGTGPASAASNTITTPSLPGAPTIGTATAGVAQASVTFTQPASNGGSAIISYTATSIPGNITGTLSQAGSGTITVTGLASGTAYTITVTATNAVGTGAASAASNAVTLTFVCGQPFTDTRDSKVYNTVLIGTQCWMAQNMNVGTKIAGSGNQNNTGTIEKYCFDDLDANCTTYGGLYQWDEMMQYSTTEGAQGICPTGWHLPARGEWITLTNYLGVQYEAGGKMKEIGFTHWNSPNEGATNTSGFTGLGGGYRWTDASFLDIRRYGFFWSSTQVSTDGADARNLEHYDASVWGSTYEFRAGFSVRCIRD